MTILLSPRKTFSFSLSSRQPDVSTRHNKNLMFKQILWSFGLGHHAALNMETNIMEEHGAFSSTVEENSMFL
jgi:hypothetical protein